MSKYLNQIFISRSFYPVRISNFAEKRKKGWKNLVFRRNIWAILTQKYGNKPGRLGVFLVDFLGALCCNFGDGDDLFLEICTEKLHE